MGFKRRGTADKKHFYNIAQSALEERRDYLVLSHDLGFQVQPKELSDRIEQAGRMLASLIRSVGA